VLISSCPVTASGHDAQASQQFAGDDSQLIQNLSLRRAAGHFTAARKQPVCARMSPLQRLCFALREAVMLTHRRVRN